jgi:hypothetical protein
MLPGHGDRRRLACPDVLDAEALVVGRSRRGSSIFSCKTLIVRSMRRSMAGGRLDRSAAGDTHGQGSEEIESRAPQAQAVNAEAGSGAAHHI